MSHRSPRPDPEIETEEWVSIEELRHRMALEKDDDEPEPPVTATADVEVGNDF